jgi:GDP-4-dehydro-6-deoxy-D-mannose reductase
MAGFLVLGGTGFIGGHLVRHLVGQGTEVTVVSRGPGEAAAGAGHPSRVACDVFREFDSLTTLIGQTKPDYIIHLVGGRRASPADSAVFSFRLMRALADARLDARLVLAGSAAEYGHPVSLPVDETHPLRPVSEYGFAKAAQSWMARAVYEEIGLPVLVARIFNAVGPGQGREYLLGSVVGQAVEVLEGRREAVEVGDDAVRDYVDVRDVARALEAVALRGRPGEAYNVCRGEPVSVEQVLVMTAAACDLKVRPRRVPRGVREAVVPALYGTRGKISREIGWVPAISLSQSLADMVAHEEVRLARAPAGRGMTQDDESAGFGFQSLLELKHENNC